MSKKDNFSDEVVMADALLRLKSIENLLIAKGVFTAEEFSAELNKMAAQIAKTILQKAQVSGDLDEIIKKLQEGQKPDNN